MNIKEAHKHSSKHRDMVERSTTCGCFHCLRIFAPTEITSWIDERTDAAVTAQCPFCGVDSVLPSAAGVQITPEFLAAMKDYWFSSPFERMRRSGGDH